MTEETFLKTSFMLYYNIVDYCYTSQVSLNSVIVINNGAQIYL